MLAVLVFLAAAGALLALVATRPDAFRVERSATIAAPPATVFALVNDFHQWARWSPWEKLDPQMHKAFEGAPSGVGASLHWLGNKKAGEGRMTITESQPSTHLVTALEFIRPFAASNVAAFALAPVPGGVAVTWSMTGRNNFMLKAFGLFANMDQLIGKDFEEGLANLKRVAEEGTARAGPPASA